MKILDIIADESLNEGGAAAREGGRYLGQYLERKAAERALAAIEKKYANDIVRQKAAKDVAERYAKLLADAEVAGTPRIKGGLTDLEALLKDAAKNPNHPTLSGNKYYQDTAFMQMVDDLAEARKKQIVRDIHNPPAPPKEKKPKDDKSQDAGKTAGKATAAEVKATSDAVDKERTIFTKDMSVYVSRLKWWLAEPVLGLYGLWEIRQRYESDIKTIDAWLERGEIPPDDADEWPRTNSNNTPVSSTGDATYLKEDGSKHFFVYSTPLQRMLSWRSHRSTLARKARNKSGLQYMLTYTGASAFGSGLAKIKFLKGLAKALDAGPDANTFFKVFSGGVQGALAGINTLGKHQLARLMSDDNANEAIKSIVWNQIKSYDPIIDYATDSLDKSLLNHQVALEVIMAIIVEITDMLGYGAKVKTEPARTNVNTSNVDAANPIQKDPSQKSTPVDQTDSTGKQPTPVAKPVEKNPPPEKKAADTTRPEENTAAARGAKFTQAKDAGVATVVIGNRTYKTADFVDDGGYWTNPKTGESFVKN